METRASYVVVGAFSLLIVVGALLFVLWAARSTKGDLRTYEVVFRQSVAGLAVGSGVSLEGVRIGQVSRIKVSPDDPGQVIVHIQVTSDAPVRQDSHATLEPQGITGMSVVAISGGSASSPLLAEAEGSIARIPSRASKIQEIMNSVPAILSSFDQVVARTNQLISPENTEVFGQFLASLAEIALAVAQNKEALIRGMDGFGKAGHSFAESGKRLEKLIVSAQSLVDRDFRSAARAVDLAAEKVGDVAAAAEPGVKRFSRDSVEELQRVLVEARRLLLHISTLTQKLESDPRRFLLGNPLPEFSAQ